jgi:hypothetical protein
MRPSLPRILSVDQAPRIFMKDERTNPDQAHSAEPPTQATGGPFPCADPRPGTLLEGRLRLLLLYDVGEQVDLARIQAIFGSRPKPVDALLASERAAPYIRFSQAPLADKLEGPLLIDGQQAELTARYYSFGVVVLHIEVPFRCDWRGVVQQFSSLMDAPNQLQEKLKAIFAHLAEKIRPAITRPSKEWLSERYMIVNALKIADAAGHSLTPEQVKSSFGAQLAALLRGETAALSREETEHVLSGSLSYYESDLTVITSAAAFVYDRPDEAAVESYILEYARIQLLEFRYYDSLLEGLLDELYNTLGKTRNVVFARWSIPREANRFNRIRVDTMELKERVDNAVKFVSDAFYAKMYRLAASRMGVSEYRQLVDEKIETAGQLHEYMIDQFNEARTFVLEVVAAVLALIDVLFLLRGH